MYWMIFDKFNIFYNWMIFRTWILSIHLKLYKHFY